MRSFHQPGRSTVHAVNGLCATSQPLAAATAIDILRRGGNAIDAAIAASAVLCVVEPMSTGIGGDCFALYAPGGRDEVIGLNGSGRAPAGANVEWFVDRGIETIGLHSVHAVTVPGAIDAWDTLMRDHGTMGLDTVLEPAIRYAEEGYAVSPRIAHDWSFFVERLSKETSAARHYLVGARSPAVGEIHRAPALAQTLRTIAREGRKGFYEGRVAEDMVTYLKQKGGHHTLEDFAATRCNYVTPIETDYRGHKILEIPPNGQGVTTLIMLNALEQFPMATYDPLGAERFHLECEASRLAFEARDRFVGDPEHGEVPTEWLKSKDLGRTLAARIDPERALGNVAEAAGPVYRDTIYLTVVDRDRNAVSFINSLYFAFGSALVAPETGVTFQNRGAGFVIEPGHPNCVAGGKRPLHTIIPAMMCRDGRVEMAFGVMGGAYQPVGQTHVVTNLLDYGMDIQAALDCPRAFHVQGRYELEEGVPASTADRLAARGHDVGRARMPWGGGQGIVVDWQNGTLAGGSDPRKDGAAIGY